MKPSTITTEEIDAILASELDASPPESPNPTTGGGIWLPDLNKPTQYTAWEDPSQFILMYGEKGSGKSAGAAHKLIRHCYENWDALGVIITPSIRTGKFGLIYDLESSYLPSWTDGIGLDWRPSKLDPNTKDRILKIGNRHGGWSTVLQISIPHEEAVAPRLKGISPSFVLADELTDCNGRAYFTFVAAQLNRRRHISGPQQYVATCNPKGPSNWVYQVFFEESIDKATGKRDPRYAIYHVPFRENAHRPEMAGYIATLEAAVRGDPIERARLIDGEWIDRPTGESLFTSFGMRHIVGDARLGTGINPVPFLPVVIGYDLGQVYNAAVFLQLVPTNEGNVWIAFDEVIYLNKRILYKQMARDIIDKILFWNSAMGRKLNWEHIADDSAVNQWRPGGSGSFDAWEFEREYNMASVAHGLGRMRMIGAPKGSGSVQLRVRTVQGLVIADHILVSARCHNVIAMMRNLEGKDDDPLTPKKTSAGHIHVFDAMSYPILKQEMHGIIDPARTPAIRVTSISV